LIFNVFYRNVQGWKLPGRRRRFFALDQFPENADRLAIAYDEVFAEVEAGAAGSTH
jgi:hypothetical protein